MGAGIMTLFFAVTVQLRVSPFDAEVLSMLISICMNGITARVIPADIAKGIPNARDIDDKMADARRALDWDAQFECALDPETAKKIRDDRAPEDDHSDTCSMCGKFSEKMSRCKNNMRKIHNFAASKPLIMKNEKLKQQIIAYLYLVLVCMVWPTCSTPCGDGRSPWLASAWISRC